jgi:hypothetical protein
LSIVASLFYSLWFMVRSRTSLHLEIIGPFAHAVQRLNDDAAASVGVTTTRARKYTWSMGTAGTIPLGGGRTFAPISRLRLRCVCAQDKQLILKQQQ